MTAKIRVKSGEKEVEYQTEGGFQDGAVGGMVKHISTLHDIELKAKEDRLKQEGWLD